MGGLLTFNGNAWNNSDGSARTLTIGGNGNTLITGSINTSGAGTKTLTKTGSGSLTIAGTATTLNGPVNINGGRSSRDFRSLNNNSAPRHQHRLRRHRRRPDLAGPAPADNAGWTSKTSSTSPAPPPPPSIYANQEGPTRSSSTPTSPPPAAAQGTRPHLGGTNTADNLIHGAISQQAVATTAAWSALTKSAQALGCWPAPTPTPAPPRSPTAPSSSSPMPKLPPSCPARTPITFGANNSFAGATLEFAGPRLAKQCAELGQPLPTRRSQHPPGHPGAQAAPHRSCSAISIRPAAPRSTSPGRISSTTPSR
jgi:autotransporter-associated beta strand protein